MLDLLEHGSNVNIRDDRGATAAHYASSARYFNFKLAECNKLEICCLNKI
jgi:ankyrin repeat protein